MVMPPVGSMQSFSRDRYSYCPSGGRGLRRGERTKRMSLSGHSFCEALYSHFFTCSEFGAVLTLPAFFLNGEIHSSHELRSDWWEHAGRGLPGHQAEILLCAGDSEIEHVS